MLNLVQTRWSLVLAGVLLTGGVAYAQPGKACMGHESAQSIEQVIRNVDSAKQSSDVERMRTALDQAKKPLSEMRDCLNTRAASKGPGPVATNAKDLPALCGVEIDEVRAPKAIYGDITYYFCSENDRADFEKQPDKYLKKQSRH